MRDEREKRDWREMSRTSYTCANPAYLASPTQLARHTFLASPARRASRARCEHSSALSLTDPDRTYRTHFRRARTRPRLTPVGRGLTPCLEARPTGLTALHRLRHARDP